MAMNIKWKSILIVLLIITTISAVFIIRSISDNRENLEYLLDTEITSIRGVVKTIENENNRRYRSRIQTFVNYTDLPKQEAIISAFARRDREELLKLSAPFLKRFREENPYFSTFAWLTTDNHSFLRVHRPSSFGQAIGKMRPDIVDANINHQQYASYMVAKTGLQYRIVQPVSYEGKHVGIVQFGLQDNLLLDTIRDTLNISVGMAIPNEKFSFITHSKLPSRTGSSYTIQSMQTDILQEDIDKIDWKLDEQKVTLRGKTYLIANTLNLLNYQQESQGYIFVALDISDQVSKLKSRIKFILLLSCGLLLLSFIVLHLSFNILLKNIEKLNRALQQSNANLEIQVAQRTEKLQKALKEVKTLEGILPLCSYCKKIRNEKEEWQDVDAYIHTHSQADISHGICPECAQKHYPDHFESNT